MKCTSQADHPPWLQKLSVFDLPMPVYVAEEAAGEGGVAHVIACNDPFRKVFGILPEEPLPFPSARFYFDPEERKEVAKAFEEALARGETLDKYPLHLRGAKDQAIWAFDFAMKLSSEPGQPQRRLCCLVDITREENIRRLVNELPVGLYQLDANDRVVECNQRFAELIGLQVDDVLGRNVSEFYADPEEAAAFHRRVVEEHTVVDHPLEVIHQVTKQPVLMAVSAALVAIGESYQGRVGAVRDISQAERYRQIIDELPIILFKIQVSRDGVDLIEHCNDRFAEVLGSTPKKLIGQPIERFHRSASSRNDFLARITTSTGRGETFQDEVELKNMAGQPRTVAVNIRQLRDRRGNIVGRVGGALDVTKTKKLQEKVSRLTSDTGAVLHAYTHTLTTLAQTIEPVADFLGPDPFVRAGYSGGAAQVIGRGDLKLALEELLPRAKILATAVERALAARSEPGREGAWDIATWGQLTHLRQALNWPLQTQTQTQSPEVAHAYFRDIAQEVLRACGRVTQGHLPRDFVRQLELGARELGRLACLLSLASVKYAVVEMDSQVRALRENLTLDQREEVREDISLFDLNTQAVASQSEYFHLRDIECRNRLNELPLAGKWFVHGSRRDLVRALGNLLHNAIKYSWSRPAEAGRPWVELRANLLPSGQVAMGINNFGVPIPEDELPLVFELGYRGRFSADRNRAGTGVGLHDARDVAQSHGGDVTIMSHPATPADSADPEYYSHPFKTIATLTLPVFRKEK